MIQKENSPFADKTINEMLKMQEKINLDIEDLNLQHQQLKNYKENKLFWTRFNFKALFDCSVIFLISSVIMFFIPNLLTAAISTSSTLLFLVATFATVYSVFNKKFKKISAQMENINTQIQEKIQLKKQLEKANQARQKMVLNHTRVNEVADKLKIKTFSPENIGKIEEEIIRQRQERRKKLGFLKNKEVEKVQNNSAPEHQA